MRPAPPKWPLHFSHPSVEAVGRKLKRIFDQNASTEYFSREEIRDYSYYENLLIQGLEGIDRRMESGALSPRNCRTTRESFAPTTAKVRACIYIGSFDPFQLTHLAVAVRFLASELSNSTLSLWCRGLPDPAKPLKTDYAFAFRLPNCRSRHLRPLHQGARPRHAGRYDRDCEEVHRDAQRAHARIDASHRVGRPAGRRALYCAGHVDWRKEAQESGVHYLHSTHVVQRGEEAVDPSYFDAIKNEGANAVLDTSIVATPSSTDFRTRQAFTIVLPTSSIRDKMEIIFRTICTEAGHPIKE